MQDASIRWMRRGDERSSRSGPTSSPSSPASASTSSTRPFPASDLCRPVVARAGGRGRQSAVEQADSLSLAFLVLLEELTPLERAAYLLHDIFGYPFEEVARYLGRSGRPAASWPRGRATHRGAASALRRRSPPRPGDDRPFPPGVRHRGPRGAPRHAVRRCRRLDRRRRQSSGGDAAGGRSVPQLEVPDERGQEGPWRAAGAISTGNRPASSWTATPWWRRWSSTSSTASWWRSAR